MTQPILLVSVSPQSPLLKSAVISILQDEKDVCAYEVPAMKEIISVQSSHIAGERPLYWTQYGKSHRGHVV